MRIARHEETTSCISKCKYKIIKFELQKEYRIIFVNRDHNAICGTRDRKKAQFSACSIKLRASKLIYKKVAPHSPRRNLQRELSHPIKSGKMCAVCNALGLAAACNNHTGRGRQRT